MVDFEPTEAQESLRRLTRDFVKREVMPSLDSREWVEEPEERFPWDLIEKGSRLGLRTLALPEEWGGGGADTLTICVVAEELAVGDLGLAICFDQTWKISKLLVNIMNEDQKGRFLPPFASDHRFLLGTAQAEPGAGSDNILPYDEPEAGVALSAREETEGFVLNGTKHFISNGGVARLYIVYARTDRSVGIRKGLSAFLVPAESPGFSIGCVHDKMGQRLAQNAELVFNDVRVPRENLLGKLNEAFTLRAPFVRGSNVEAAATVLGPARAAYEAALSHAQERVQGGRPIIEHQAVGLLLTDMFIELEAARNFLWKAAWAVDKKKPEARLLSSLAKVFVSERAFEVTRKAMEVFGGMGYMRDAPVEKLWRDAASFLHSDGANQVLRLRSVPVLRDLAG